APDQARFDAAADVRDARAFEENRVLDLAAAHGDAVAHGGERPDVRVLDQRALADDGRASHGAPHEPGARFHHDPAEHLAVLDQALHARHQRVEHDAVRLEDVLEPAGGLPPALDD